MGNMPFVGILAADPCQIRSRSLGAPQHRMIVFGLDGERVRAVTLNLISQGADHLRVAGVAPLADIDVASRKLERRINAHLVCRLLLEKKKRIKYTLCRKRTYMDFINHMTLPTIARQ